MAGKHGLGKGLGALIKDRDTMKAEKPENTETSQDTGVLQVSIEQVTRSPLQPRRKFDAEALSELSASIRAQGVLQPLLVRRVNDNYELIAGERRFRAATEAGLKQVPVLIIEANDNEVLQLALIENLQRENLNIIEEAEGYRVLSKRFKLTQEEISQRVGKARASVANALRILDLPEAVTRMLSDGHLTAGHAKVLTSLDIPDEQNLYARRVITESLSVRALENLIKKAQQAPRKPRASRDDMPRNHITYISDQLHQFFGTGVKISPSKTYANGKKGKGTIEIDFYSNDDLDRILQLLNVAE